MISKEWNPFPKALKKASNSLSNSFKSWTISITIPFPKFIRPNSKHCNEHIKWHVCFHEWDKSFHTCLILCHFLESNSRLIFSSKKNSCFLLLLLQLHESIKIVSFSSVTSLSTGKQCLLWTRIIYQNKLKQSVTKNTNFEELKHKCLSNRYYSLTSIV